jgi:hypothetical protein
VTPSWSRGNAAQRSDRRGWLVGHFIDDPMDPHYSKDVEIKWGVHPAGDERTEWSAGRHDRTILILVSGSWRMELASADQRDAPTTVTLDTQGDYVLWEKDIDHRWRAEADSVVITVRWPSMP